MINQGLLQRWRIRLAVGELRLSPFALLWKALHIIVLVLLGAMGALLLPPPPPPRPRPPVAQLDADDEDKDPM